MRTATIVILLSAPLLLAACGRGAESDHMEAMSDEDHDMALVENDAPATSASAQGTVTAIDAEAGTITIDHEPVPALDWPEMVMAFEASEQIRNDVAIGDQISFEFSSGSEGNVVKSVTGQ